MPRHVYGPVPSRRLGRSLGVDLVPLKTCSLDCVYCQLGSTADTTLERAQSRVIQCISHQKDSPCPHMDISKDTLNFPRI